MPSNTPLFSIVMPTRNRANLLPNALRSALNQEFDDYEIVIIANNCQDNTREVVESMATNRVRYFETEKSLSAIDNWELGWTKAKGQYVIYLSDDDALVPNALKWVAENTLHGTPPIVCWEDALYYYPNWKFSKTDLRNTLLLFFFNEELTVDVPTKQLREQVAKFEIPLEHPSIPKLCNCALNHDFFEAWRQRLGHLFIPVADSFIWFSIHITSKIRVLHRPLTVRGIQDQSAGSYQGGLSYSPEFLEESKDTPMYSETRLNIPLQKNQLIDTFLRVNQLLSKHGIKPYPIDIPAFYTELANKLFENKKLLPHWEIHAETLLNKSKDISLKLYEKIHAILTKTEQDITPPETMRALQERNQQLALNHLPNIEAALKNHGGDIKCALSVLGLQEELLVDLKWSHMYLFGERLHIQNVYSMSTHVNFYYDLLLKGRKMNPTPAKNHTLLSKVKRKIMNYVL